MTTPLQSLEYAALVAAREARDSAYAKYEGFRKALDAAADVLNSVKPEGLLDAQRDIIAVATKMAYMRLACEAVFDADVTAAQSAFDAAYPAPADVVTAVEAVSKYASAQAGWVASFEASLTDGQRDMQAAIKDCQTALDAAVTHAKTLIEAAQVSPSKAFVVKRSVKASIGNPYHLIDMIDQRDAPIELIKIDETALAKWVNKMGSVELDVELNESVSVAFYAAKL